jgi:hypothetical protein
MSEKHSYEICLVIIKHICHVNMSGDYQAHICNVNMSGDYQAHICNVNMSGDYQAHICNAHICNVNMSGEYRIEYVLSSLFLAYLYRTSICTCCINEKYVWVW